MLVERYCARSKQANQVPAPDTPGLTIVTDGDLETQRTNHRSSTSNRGVSQRTVAFVLADNNITTFPVGNGSSTTPRVPPPVVSTTESTGEQDRRSSRWFELEAAASSVVHPSASAMLQVKLLVRPESCYQHANRKKLTSNAGWFGLCAMHQEAAQHRASTDAALRSASAEAEIQRSIDRDLANALSELETATQQRDNQECFQQAAEGTANDGCTATELSVCLTPTYQRAMLSCPSCASNLRKRAR